MHLHGTARINNKGHLEIGKCDTVELVERFGSPLMVYDEALIRERARAFVQAFKNNGLKAQVAYASKAFSCIAICQIAAEEGLSLDVVSAGELYTALKAGYPAEKIHFHGNNKSKEELLFALDANIGCYVVDNFHELKLLQELTNMRQQQVNILFRITPGVEAHTHEYITTGQEDSKFGFDIESGQVLKALKQALSSEYTKVLGLHSHIGSQIFETEGFSLAIEKCVQLMDHLESETDWELQVLNVGGGFGIRYDEADQPLPVDAYVDVICAKVKEIWSERDRAFPEIWIEPGRSIVGEAGTTLYTLGAEKDIPGVRKYISVNGGMSDNLRVALYKAKYEAALANKMDEAHQELYTVAGKLCETGDILIWDVKLPHVEADDILAVSCTGAYGYSMANNYNRIGRPAVVLVHEGTVQEIIRRETLDDLIRLDQPLKSRVTL